MRVLLMLRGAPGCGKSTWIRQHGLEQYTLSADGIRMQCSSPAMTVRGGFEINPANDTVVWKMLFQLLELRMQNGEFTVIDATNSKTSEMNRYKELCDSYRYRMYCVDMTDIPIDVVKQRNASREPLKRVPEAAIDKMYSRFETQKIPAGIKVIRPDELDSIYMKKIDLSSYDRIHVIGDIHGCWTALKEYLEEETSDEANDFFIFTGDYIDRGLENAEVIKYLCSVAQKDNVLLLEGNHERWLWIWANGGTGKSKEFELHTRAELEDAGIDRKEARKLYRRFGQCAWFDYHGREYLITHGGLSTMPANLSFVATSQMIKGVGNYNDFEAVENSWLRTTPENCFQIHGHRNTKNMPVKANARNFNLEGRVEFGGALRAVQLLPEGEKCFEIHNEVFRAPEETVVYEKHQSKQKSIGDIILELRQNKYVSEKRCGDISSFNFTKQAFYDKVWDEQTMKARGLYINIPKAKVVARAYDKFFNINERPETKLDMLQYKLTFPANAYVKENGFLGIAAYNEEDGSLFITTKSSPEGDFAQWLRQDMETILGAEKMDAIKAYSKEHNVSFVFECVDMERDPHIIEYDENALYLLDIVYNEIPFRKLSFDEMCAVADTIGLTHKEHAFTLESWQDFFDWYYEVTAEDYLYNGQHIEGFVVEGADGYMVKLKLAYYNFWKFMRSVAHETIRKGYIDSKRTAALTTPVANQFYGWVKKLREETLAANTDPDMDKNAVLRTIPTSICRLRTRFFNENHNRTKGE